LSAIATVYSELTISHICIRSPGVCTVAGTANLILAICVTLH